MLKNPEDRRARRSRKLLKESLLTLMKRKAFSEISVRDIAEEADMNRGTFYLHYSGTLELLQSLEAELLEELQALIDAHLQETVDTGTCVRCWSRCWTSRWGTGRRSWCSSPAVRPAALSRRSRR